MLCKKICSVLLLVEILHITVKLWVYPPLQYITFALKHTVEYVCKTCINYVRVICSLLYWYLYISTNMHYCLVPGSNALCFVQKAKVQCLAIAIGYIQKGFLTFTYCLYDACSFYSGAKTFHWKNCETTIPLFSMNSFIIMCSIVLLNKTIPSLLHNWIQLSDSGSVRNLFSHLSFLGFSIYFIQIFLSILLSTGLHLQINLFRATWNCFFFVESANRHQPQMCWFRILSSYQPSSLLQLFILSNALPDTIS